MQKILLIVQARLGSTRLPQKVLKPLLGKPLIGRLFERLKQLQTPHQLILATTRKAEDTRLVRYLQGMGISVFRGETENVLERYYQCAKQNQGEIIVRITGDCPLIQPHLIDEMLQNFSSSHMDYFSNVHPRSYPKGFDVEIFTFEALEKARFDSKDPHDLEHVTPYLVNHPEFFSLKNKQLEKDYSSFNVSVDTLEDFYWVEKLFQRYYASNPLFGLTEILEFAKDEPHFINRLVCPGSPV